MNWHRAAVAVLLLVSICWPALARPIKFAPGTSSSAVRGTAFSGGNDIWTVKARKGQRMIVRINADGRTAHFDITPPGGGVLAQNELAYQGRLDKTGTYTISVYTEAAQASYSLEVSVK